MSSPLKETLDATATPIASLLALALFLATVGVWVAILTTS
jgi:hypothetical protein